MDGGIRKNAADDDAKSEQNGENRLPLPATGWCD
jgi:hypothetical protein